jgi:hypothetical protein
MNHSINNDAMATRSILLSGDSYMNKNIFAALLIGLALVTVSAAKSAEKVPPMPHILANSRFVYVTAFDGDQFDPRILPEDRDAIGRVEEAIQKWGKLTLVYRAQEADIILAVQSRPSEDELALYQAHEGDFRSRPSQIYLWRVMGRGGLQKSEIPLVSQFEKAWEGMTK